MATQTDKVVVESIWKLQDHASGPAKHMAERFRFLNNEMRISNGHLRLMQTTLAAGSVAMAGYGAVKLAKGIVQANHELENMKYGIGAILFQSQKLGFMPNKYKDMNDALKEAEGVYQRLFIYSQKAVGTADDYTKAWRDIAMSVTMAGGGIGEIEQVAQLIVPLSKQLGLIPENAFRDVQQYLTGRMTVRDVVPRMLGIGNDPTYSKMTDAQRLSKLMTALETGRAGAKSYEGTFEAVSSTFKSLFTQIQREGGKGFFEQIKSDMNDFNQSFLSNEKEIYNQAVQMTQSLTEAYTVIKDDVLWTVKHFREIKNVTVDIFKLWISMKAAEVFVGGINRLSLLRAEFIKWGGVAAISEKGVRNLTNSLISLNTASVAAATAVFFAAQKWYEVYKMFEEDKDYKKTQQPVAGQVAMSWLEQTNAPGVTMTAEIWDKVNSIAKANTERRLQEKYTSEIPWYSMMMPKTPNSAYISKNRPDIWNEEFNKAMADNLKRDKSTFDFGPQVPKDVNVNNDFRGSRINITVDSRHADPNRVAATVISALGRAAKSRTGSNMGFAGSVA